MKKIQVLLPVFIENTLHDNTLHDYTCNSTQYNIVGHSLNTSSLISHV